MNREFDVLIIGSGPGGYIAALRAAKLGFKVACIEKSSTLGGTCLNVGCIPSKALLQSTEYYAWLKNSSQEHGMEAGSIAFDLGKMMQRKEKIVKGLVDGIDGLFKNNKIEKIQGEARLTGTHHVEVIQGSQKELIHASHIIVATGSEPIALPLLPFDEKQVVSSTGALSLREVPKHLIVIGGGIIGVELASVYQRLGSKVTIVEMLDRIIPSMDFTMSRQLLQLLRKQGMDIFLGAKVKEAMAKPESVELTIEQEQRTLLMESDKILVAIGRRPYTKNLGLEEIGISLSPKGFIVVDENFRTKFAHIYAIGDVIEGPMLAHRASHEGNAVAELIAGEETHLNYMSIPSVVYTHPEVAGVGLTEEEAQAANVQVVIGTSFFRGNGRARCSGETEGLVKVLGDKATGRLLGMHIIGAQASELISEGMIALEKKATIRDLASACHAHPTLSETIMEACQEALNPSCASKSRMNIAELDK